MPKVDPKTRKIKELEELLDTSKRNNEFKAGQIKELNERIDVLEIKISEERTAVRNILNQVTDQSVWMRNFIEKMCLPAEKLEAKKDPDFDRFNGMRGMR